MLARRDNSPAAAAAAAATKAEISLSAGNSDLHLMPSIWKRKNKNKDKNKKRFSDEQIRLLESMFETESRPELQMKQQLAYELGLHPRQVAIWFQNKRARSKSKLMEQEYNILKSSYDTLASKFDSLKKENQCLLTQLQRLGNLLENPQESKNHEVGEHGKGIDEEYDNTDTHSEAEGKPHPLLDYNHGEVGVPTCDNTSDNVEYFSEENNILNTTELLPEGSFISSGNWCSFESNFEPCYVLDHPSCRSEWWDL